MTFIISCNIKCGPGLVHLRLNENFKGLGSCCLSTLPSSSCWFSTSDLPSCKMAAKHHIFSDHMHKQEIQIICTNFASCISFIKEENLLQELPSRLILRDHCLGFDYIHTLLQGWLGMDLALKCKLG